MLELYNNLLSLTQRNDAFYFVDQNIDTAKYRIYLYRLASYTDFCEPDALEARGTTFELDSNDQPIRIACRPFHKFHNYNECPFTMNLDLSQVDYITEKMDGSLISTFNHNGVLRLKTKGSLSSEQAVEATKLLDNTKYNNLKKLLTFYTDNNYTVNLEYTARSDHPHRIVIGYDEAGLTVLSVRHNITGEYIVYKALTPIFNEYLVKDYTEIAISFGIEEFVNNSVNVVGFEGFVVRLFNGIMFKLKGAAYSAAHKLRDGVTSSPRNLFEAIVSGASDDLKSLFTGDSHINRMINEMEDHVFKAYNSLVNYVESNYELYKKLDRKNYAITCQNLPQKHTFPLFMSKFLGRNVDYMEFMIKNYDIYQLPASILQENLIQEV